MSRFVFANMGRKGVLVLLVLGFLVVQAVSTFAVTVDIYQDMETGADGDTVTATVAGNGSHGSGGSWSVTGSNLKVRTAAEHALRGPVTVAGGSTYSDIGSTRGWGWNDNVDLQYAAFTTSSSKNAFVISCFLTVGPSPGLNELYDAIQPGAGKTYAIVQMENNGGGNLGLWIEAWNGGTVHSPVINVTQGTTYWVSFKADAANGLASLNVYEIVNWTLVGSVTRTMTTGTMNLIRFGRTDSHGDTSATTSYIDDICISWTDTTFPFVPSPVVPSPVVPSRGEIGGIPVENAPTNVWAAAGVPGGIPSRTNIYTTLNPGATASQIVSAVNACPSNQVVYLSAGTYNISPIGFGDPGPTYCTLRGAGMGQTILAISNGTAAVDVGSYPPWFGSWGDSQNITAGGTQGSGTITVSNASSYLVGDMCVIDMDNADWIQGYGTGGGTSATYNTDSAGKGRDGNRVQLHPCRITGKSGNDLTFDPPLLYALDGTRSPQISRASRRPGPISFGMEDLTVTTSGSSTHGIFFNGSYASWLKNVELSGWGYYGFFLRWNVHFEMRGCYIHDPSVYAVDHGYGLQLDPDSGSLVIDNIIYNCQSTVLVQGGCTGNVLAYNVFAFSKYVNGGYTGEWLQHEINGNHTPFPAYNLFEGNYTGQIQSDYYYGPSGWGTIFRNRIPGNSSATTQHRVAVSIDAWQRNYSVVGNQLGERTAPNSITLALPGVTRTYAQPGTLIWGYDPGSASFSSPYIYRLGYPYSGNNGSSTGTAVQDSYVNTNTLRHGNWDAANNAVVWDSSIADHNLPNSLFLTAKPSWFGNLAWPPFGPEAPTDVASDLAKIPAGYRLLNNANPPSGGPDTTAPVISNVAIGLFSNNAGTISWNTDEPSTSSVDYGLTAGYGFSMTNSILVTSHSIRLTNLISATTYHYRVSSSDASNNSATGLDNTILTPVTGVKILP